MRGTQVCTLNGKPVDIEEALRLRDEQRAISNARIDFRCLNCGEVVTPYKAGFGPAHFSHQRRNPSCQLSELQEWAYRYPRVTDPFIREVSGSQELADKDLIITGRKDEVNIDYLELMDPLALAAKYPLATIPILPLSRAKYPYAITNVGETRVIGPTSEAGLVNRLRSSVSNYNKNHKEVFKVVIHCDEVYLHRMT